ncbi:MAG: CDGSH iron-sulfur domain-containing protein [Nitrospinales bacterium]
MSESEIGPMKITGEEEIAVCTCMQSNHWPYCDASHHTLSDSAGPEIISLDKNKTYYLCQCFKTKNRPFCDGSHNKKPAKKSESTST